MKITRDIAHAASTDAADRNMRRHGRTAWNEEDYSVAIDTFNRLFPVDDDGIEPDHECGDGISECGLCYARSEISQ